MTVPTKTPDLLKAVRAWHPSHPEVMDLLACLSYSIKHSENALGDRCRTQVIDLLAEAFESVERDKIAQQVEQTWADRRTT